MSQHTLRWLSDICFAVAWGITYTFSGKVEIFPLHLREEFQELTKEASELGREVGLILDIRCPLRETSSDRLFYPENAGEIRPAVWIGRGPRLTKVP